MVRVTIKHVKFIFLKVVFPHNPVGTGFNVWSTPLLTAKLWLKEDIWQKSTQTKNLAIQKTQGKQFLKNCIGNVSLKGIGKVALDAFINDAVGRVFFYCQNISMERVWFS